MTMKKAISMLKEFLSEETGSASKKACLTAGIIAFLASIASPVNAEEGHDQVCKIRAKCENTVMGTVEREVNCKVSLGDVRSDDDAWIGCAEPGSRDYKHQENGPDAVQTMFDNFKDENGEYQTYIEISDTFSGDSFSDDEYIEGTISFDDISLHGNSISLDSSGEEIRATHNHSMNPADGCDLKFVIHGDEDESTHSGNTWSDHIAWVGDADIFPCYKPSELHEGADDQPAASVFCVVEDDDKLAGVPDEGRDEDYLRADLAGKPKSFCGDIDT